MLYTCKVVSYEVVATLTHLKQAASTSVYITVAPLAEAALVRVVQVPAGSMVPSFGTYRVPYRSLTFIRGYRSFVSAGESTWDSIP